MVGDQRRWVGPQAWWLGGAMTWMGRVSLVLAVLFAGFAVLFFVVGMWELALMLLALAGINFMKTRRRR